MKPDLNELLTRVAEREGVPKSRVLERALRRELEAPDGTRLDVNLPKERIADLLNAASRMDRRPDELIEALIRLHLRDLTDRNVDPGAWMEQQRQRARELVG